MRGACDRRAAGHGGSRRVRGSRWQEAAALAMLMQSRGVLHAAEVYPDKLAQIEAELARTGLRSDRLSFATAAVDLTRGLGALERMSPTGYDVVLVDAPCSGFGTLARRPDIYARRAQVALTSEEVAVPSGQSRIELPALQGAILERAAQRVRAGGVIVYAVCTLTHAEGAGVMAEFRSRHPEFVPAAGDESVPERLRAPEVTLRPDTDGTDGFMVFRLRRATKA